MGAERIDDFRVKIPRQTSTLTESWKTSKMGSMKTTLELPNDLVREIKLQAVNEGRKLKDVIADLLRRGLGRDSENAAQANPRRKSISLPLFPSAPDAPAEPLTVEQLIALEQETLTHEDLERCGPTL